jgi:hypothetical protein
MDCALHIRAAQSLAYSRADHDAEIWFYTAECVRGRAHLGVKLDAFFCVG